MRSNPTTATLLVLTTLLALAGCGSGATKTVSISSHKESNSIGTTTNGSHGRSAPSDTRTERAPPGTTQATRTATAPAFTKEAPATGGEGLDQAVATVKAHGYTPQEPAQYHARQTLRVLIATRTGSADGYAQQAFFFLDGRYLGTDTSTPSAAIKLVSQADTEVTLAYRLYRPGDPLCCARGGETDVRFQLNNGRLLPLDPIPPADSSTGTSRQ